MSVLLAALLLAACTPDAAKPAEEAPCAAREVLDDSGSCVPEACGTSRWGNIEVDAQTLYVAAEADSDGDGSQGAPFTSIQDAADLAGERGGGLVVVAAGTYLENPAFYGGHDGVQIAGRCAELAVIDGSEGEDDEPAFKVEGTFIDPEVALSGMTFTGGPSTGLWVEGASVEARSLVISDNSRIGVVATGPDTRLHLATSTIADTAMTAGGKLGRGIEVVAGAALTAESCAVERNHDVGVYASDEGTTVTLVGTWVGDTQTQADGTWGRGVNVQDGASLWAESSVVERNHEVGVFAAGEGTTVTLKETTIIETEMRADGTMGWGVGVQTGASLTAESCALARNHEVGVLASGQGTWVTLLNTQVLDTEMRVDGTWGRGIIAQGGASLVAESCAVTGNHEVGVLASGEGTMMTLRDTTVSETQLAADGSGGVGISVQDGAALSAESCVVQHNHQVGVYAAGWGTAVNLVETTVADTRMEADGTGGRGVHVGSGASLTAESCVVERNREVGVYAYADGTTVILVDTTIAETQMHDDGTGGYGIAVEEGASLTAESCVVERNHNVGVFAGHEGTTVTLLGTRILDTAAAPGGSSGRGIDVSQGASLAAASCRVERNRELGVVARGGGTTVTLVNSVVANTRRDSALVFAMGVVAHQGAVIEADQLTVSDNDGPGLYANSGAALTCSRCDLATNAFAGAVVLRGSLELSGSRVSGTRPDVNLGGGVGVYAGGPVSEGDAPALNLVGTTIEAHDYSAIWLDGPGRYTLVNNTLRGGPGSSPWTGAWWHGDAVYATGGVTAWDGETGLFLESNTFQDSRHGVFLDGATATLQDNTWESNETDLWQQQCEDTTPLAEGDTAEVTSHEICPEGNRLTDTLVFESLYFEEPEPLE